MPPSGATHFAQPDQGGVTRDPGTIFSHRMPGAMDAALLQNAVTMNVSARRDDDQIVVDVTIFNDQTGHHIPTDSPLRQMILLVQVSDANGQALTLEQGSVVPDWGGQGNLEDGYFAGLPGKGYAKILMELWTEISPSGAYWNPTRILSDTRIPALGEDTTSYVFSAPQPGPVEVDVRLIYRRAFVELMDQKGWQIPDILMEHQSIALVGD